MTQTTSEQSLNGEFNPASQLALENSNNARTHAIICYVLLLLSCVTGITGLIALIWAYIKRGDAKETPFYDHFSNVITVFWVSLILGIIGAVTLMIIVGYFILLGTAIWVFYRLIKGVIRAVDKKPFNA